MEKLCAPGYSRTPRSLLTCAIAMADDHAQIRHAGNGILAGAKMEAAASLFEYSCNAVQNLSVSADKWDGEASPRHASKAHMCILKRVAAP